MAWDDAGSEKEGGEVDDVKVDAEKVCKGLKCCTSAKHPIPCGMCDYFRNNEYNDFWSCRISLMRDAFALIRQQQEKIKEMEAEHKARMLTLEDLEEWNETPKSLRDPIYVECSITADIGYILEINFEKLIENLKKGFARCWTWKPTNKQMEETPWSM